MTNGLGFTSHIPKDSLFFISKTQVMMLGKKIETKTKCRWVVKLGNFLCLQVFVLWKFQ
jgi:hypothetical protein